jgi:hypothetical protein
VFPAGSAPHQHKDHMKFEVRWINGYWSLFHTDWYETVRLHGLRKDAQADCDRANSQR